MKFVKAVERGRMSVSFIDVLSDETDEVKSVKAVERNSMSIDFIES